MYNDFDGYNISYRHYILIDLVPCSRNDKCARFVLDSKILYRISIHREETKIDSLQLKCMYVSFNPIGRT